MNLVKKSANETLENGTTGSLSGVLLQKAQLGIQDDEIQCLKKSLEEEQRRYTWLQHETHTHTEKLQTHIQQLLQQQQDEHRDAQRLQVTTSHKAEGAATVREDLHV